MATCSAITGQELPAGGAPDSVDILPLLLETPHDAPLRESLIHHSATGVFSVRKGPWKLIHESLGSGGWPPPRGGGPVPGSSGQLYNLADDPAEEHDLWDRRQDKVQELVALLDREL